MSLDSHAYVQILGGGGYLVGAVCEVGHRLAGQWVTLLGAPAISGIVSRDAARVVADDAGRAEPRICRRDIVQWKLPEDLGQVLYPPAGWPHRTPAVFDIVRTFEIVMPLVTEVGQRMPHTGVCRRVESQCQWVMSPSVMTAV
ncbi:hypothetical protein [Streptomyces sp. PTD9-10]|uniref:hypothetical protein n=1 Tax=Streptomyces sp. PTD9-10 TaxID=3120151 RepID=UPI0030085B78